MARAAKMVDTRREVAAYFRKNQNQKGVSMPRSNSKPRSAFARLPAGIVSAALVLGVAGLAAPATAKTVQEVTLASADQALAYCQSGKMASGDIAYIAGGPGLVQYGPDQNCAQQVATKIKVKKSIQIVGTKVSECKNASPKDALQFCQSGSMGEWDIDYVSGKVGKTLSGPGYGCVVGFSTSSIGNSVCK